MRRAVLADTGPLYAAVDPSDQYHRRARAELERLESHATAVWIPYPILFETYTLILRRLGIPAVHRWLQEVLAGAAMINPSSRDYTDAARSLLDYSDQPLTLFDAVLAALSRRLAAPVWTYDHHLKILGAPIWQRDAPRPH